MLTTSSAPVLLFASASEAYRVTVPLYPNRSVETNPPVDAYTLPAVTVRKAADVRIFEFDIISILQSFPSGRCELMRQLLGAHADISG
jgi:hypothetical protein